MALDCTTWSADKCVGGTPTASTVFGAGYEAAKAFDDDDSTRWATSNKTTNSWIQYQFSSAAYVIGGVDILAHFTAGGANSIKDFHVQGSNNGADYDTLYSDQYPELTTDTQFYKFNNDTAYSYIRIYIDNCWAGIVGAKEFEFFECDYRTKISGTKDRSLSPVAAPGLKVDARKPYVYINRHVSEMCRYPDRYIRQIIGKESEFEKPYLDWPYQAMHLKLPTPDWPDIRVPGIRRRRLTPPESVEAGEDIGCDYCIIVCYARPDCDEPIECHAAYFCTADPSGYGRDCSWDAAIIDGEGAILDIQAGDWFFPSVKIYLQVNPDIETNPKVTVRVTFRDGLGHICTEELDITCDNCPADVALSLSTGGTITQGGNTAVAITGGVAPYEISLAMASGDGFWLDSGYTKTSGRIFADGFLVYADDDSCGTVNISVTDDCGTAESVSLRNTDSGAWKPALASMSAVCGVLATSNWCATITGGLKQNFNFGCANYECTPDLSPCAHSCNHASFCTACNPAICGFPVDNICDTVCVGEGDQTWACP